jgi:undecaprenyl-diphosphatase
MTTLHAAILGALQGFAEVLPISSSAHLIIIPWFMGWQESGLTFDVALHLGTFLAMVLYFRKDIGEMLLSCRDIAVTRTLDTPAKRLPVLIVAATIPAAVVGKLFEHQVEEIFRSNPLLIAIFLAFFGIVLGVVDIAGRKALTLKDITPSRAIIIGLLQCLALLPGVSRSGITITAGLALGFSRESAARFSFLLSLPIVCGAALLKSVHLLKHGIPPGEGLPMLIGVVVSTVTGYASVAFLLKYVQKRTVSLFVWYRVVFAGVIMAAVFSGFKG